MVEIVKDKTSNTFVKPGIFTRKSIAGSASVQLFNEKKEGVFENISNSLKINCFLYFCSAALAAILFLPQVQGFFSEIGLRWVHILGLSFTISFCMNPVFAWIAKRFNILDIPDARKLHKEATPLLGGAAVFIGFSVAILTNGIFSTQVLIMMIASLILFGIGILDDFKEVSAGIKLITQLVCTFSVMSCGIVLRVLPDDLGMIAMIGNAF